MEKKKKTIWARIAGSGICLAVLGAIYLIWWITSDFGKTGWWAIHDGTGHLIIAIVSAAAGIIISVIAITIDRKKKRKLTEFN